ncbi:MAG: type II toxin-antitoxin system RelE/ParE family toxin [Butyrivibrio sp.]|nr:type II toxin-antitoxin system RelE/ParE family toxin [Butyrivibrio sp.]MBR1642158.1 type II toxin-antitoxin system RelE/ParE family toxin [Butyrivibrio sp.]
MKKYNAIRTDDAENDLERYIAYLINEKQNPQAASNVLDDYDETIDSLEEVAGSLREPTSLKLRSRGLKRMNFLHHDYLLLYRIEGETVYITNVFHQREDFESKLR